MSPLHESDQTNKKWKKHTHNLFVCKVNLTIINICIHLYMLPVWMERSHSVIVCESFWLSLVVLSKKCRQPGHFLSVMYVWLANWKLFSIQMTQPIEYRIFCKIFKSNSIILIRKMAKIKICIEESYKLPEIIFKWSCLHFEFPLQSVFTLMIFIRPLCTPPKNRRQWPVAIVSTNSKSC